jgi:hypothetical protein
LSKSFTILAAAAVALAGTVPAHAASSANDKAPPPSIAIQRANLDPLPIVSDRIGGLKISVTLVNYPGVPDRAACRFVVRAVNQGHERVATYALLRTFNGDKEAVNTWMVPTGDLKPGASSEKLYSCKTARYLQVDRQSLNGWPGRCEINGEERTPCPLTVGLEANLNLIAKD